MYNEIFLKTKQKTCDSLHRKQERRKRKQMDGINTRYQDGRVKLKHINNHINWKWTKHSQVKCRDVHTG